MTTTAKTTITITPDSTDEDERLRAKAYFRTVLEEARDADISLFHFLEQSLDITAMSGAILAIESGTQDELGAALSADINSLAECYLEVFEDKPWENEEDTASVIS